MKVRNLEKARKIRTDALCSAFPGASRFILSLLVDCDGLYTSSSLSTVQAIRMILVRSGIPHFWRVIYQDGKPCAYAVHTTAFNTAVDEFVSSTTDNSALSALPSKARVSTEE